MAFLLPTTPGFVDPDVPCGYALRPIQVIDKDRLKKIGLILPDNHDIDQWLLQHAESIKTQVAQLEKAELERHSARRQAGETSASSSANPQPTSRETVPSSSEYRAARAALKTDYDDDASHQRQFAERGIAKAQVYAWDEPLKLSGQTGPLTSDRQLSARDKALFEKLKALGAFRTLRHRNTYAATLDALGELGLQQPHFREVIDFVRARIVLVS
jgi:hypothetical protein